MSFFGNFPDIICLSGQLLLIKQQFFHGIGLSKGLDILLRYTWLIFTQKVARVAGCLLCFKSAVVADEKKTGDWLPNITCYLGNTLLKI